MGGNGYGDRTGLERVGKERAYLFNDANKVTQIPSCRVRPCPPDYGSCPDLGPCYYESDIRGIVAFCKAPPST